MGTTIQAYRCRIGTFVPKDGHLKQKNAYKYSTTRNKIHPTNFPTNFPTNLTIKNCVLLIAVILLPLLFPPQLKPNLQRKSYYSHPLYPTPDQSISLHHYLYSSETWSGSTTADIACNFIISYSINTLAASTFSMISNFQSRYLHGNRRSGGIKISHWNKGPGYLQNKMPEIKNVINGLHPHILGISEANLHHNHDQNLVQLKDYVLHTCPTLSNPLLNTSR